MDRNKKLALVKWVDALSDRRVNSFEDLRDGSVITSVLSLLGDNSLQNDKGLDTTQSRMQAIKEYVEGFYHQPLDGRKVINFEALLDGHVTRDIFEMEMGKLLLAILGCVVQDKFRERFIQPALNMEECYQFEIKEMIEAVLFNNEVDMQIPADFHEVLKKKTDTSAHLDAAFFFKLVADGIASPRVIHHGTPSGNQQHPTTSTETQVYTMYTNSPQQANTSGINIRDISSPMRIMSLSSPVTPLGALMHSPQLAQKAMLRQKVQEYKRLEVALQNEQHLRSELELDLQERSTVIEEKDTKIRDLEKQLSDIRWMRDQLDELELLRTEKENLSQENAKLQSRLMKYQDLKDHSAILERENAEIQAEVQKAREEMKLLEAVKKSCEDYRVRCHKQQLELSEQEAMLQHRIQEIEQLTQSLEETRNMYQVSVSQCNSLKKEKEELEEMMGTAHGDMGVGLEGALYAGEPMSIVTDKKLSEVQAQYDHMKENWIDPARYQTLVKDLENERETRATYERQYIEMKQKVMSTEVEIQMLKNKIQLQESSLSHLETTLQASQTTESELQKQLSDFESTLTALKQSESELLDVKERLEEKVVSVEKELSATQTELDLTRKEIEVHVNASESRRMTIMQLDNEKNEKHQSEQRLSSEVQTLRVKLEELKDQLKNQKDDARKSEESLKEKLGSCRTELDNLQTQLKNEQYEKEMTEKSLTVKVTTLEENNKELTEVLESEKEKLSKKISELEDLVSSEQESKEEKIKALKSITKEYEDYQSSTKQKEESTSCELRELQKDKQDVDLELHRLKCEIKSLSQSHEEKFKKLETKHKENDQTLKSEVEKYKSKQEEGLKVQNTLKEEVVESKQLIQKQKFEIEKLDKMIQKFKTDNSELSESIEKSKMTLIEYEYELKTCKEKMENEREQFCALQKDKDEIINSLRFQHESNFEQYKMDRSELTDKIEELEKNLELEKINFSEIRSNLEKGFSEQESKLQSEIKLLQHEKKELLSSHERYVSDLKSSSEELSRTLKDKISVMQKKMEDVESERFELECANKEQSVRIQTMSDELHNLESNQNLYLRDLTNIGSTLKNTIEENNKKVAELEESLKESSDSIARLRKEHESEKRELETALTEQSEQSKQKIEILLNESNCAKETFTAEREQWKCKLNDSNSKIAQLQKQVDDLENKLKRLSQSRADLDCQFTESKKESESLRSDLEERLTAAMSEKKQTEQSLDEYKIKMEAEVSELRDKITETESYWQAQCEQLAEEYSRGAEEHKEEMKSQLDEIQSNYESQLQNLSDEKDLQLANQVQASNDIISGLEKAIANHVANVESLCEEKVSQARDFERKLQGMSEVVVKCKDELAVFKSEVEVIKAEYAKLEEEKGEKIEVLIGEYETQITDLKTSHDEILKNVNEEHSKKIAKLESDLDEQRIRYQKMISEMEEKLGGETLDLRERFSQMKCQYETLIESKEKDTKQKISELETKIKTLETDNSSLQQTMTDESSRTQSDLNELQNKNKELENMMEKAKQEHMEIEKQLAANMGNINQLESELKSTKEELKVKGESMRKEKGEKEEMERQLEYTRDRNDTLTAELSSQQQQLAAVEEEKRMLEVEISKNKTVVEEVKQQSEKDLRFREIEKNELERQLQASQKCYEAVQKAQAELESQIERMGQDRLQLENRNRELEQRIYNYLEREKNMLESNQHQINTAADLNSNLRHQLDEKTNEIKEIHEKFNKEMEMTKVQVTQMEAMYKNDLQAITEDKIALEKEVANAQQKVNEIEAERQKLQDVNEKYNIHYNKKKEMIAQLTEELKGKAKELESYKNIEDRLVKEVAPLRERLDAETMKTKSLTAKVRSLEAQNDLADRKIRELKQLLNKDSAHFFGDSSDFMKMLKSRENAKDASFMENHPGTIPMDDSLFESANDATSDNTLTPNQRESRARKRISKSVSSTFINKENHHDLNADTVSIGSASSLAYRLRSRESAASLNRSIASFDSCKSNASVPRGTGRVFHCEDEPMELEWGRLGELQRRNTLCPAHLKTSYPVETQTYKPNKFREDALRESTMGNSTILQAETGSGRKRKKTVDTDSSGGESSDSNKSKLAKTGCVYQKPGPPTPANSRRSSKGSKSPGSRLSTGRLSKSPKTPVHSRGKRTPKRTPRHTPKRSAAEGAGNGSAKKLGKRDSVAFSVGFSPVSMHKSSRLTRQQAFIQKQPQSSGQMGPPKRKPLGIRNFLQTGL